jgi:hypothetical protein
MAKIKILKTCEFCGKEFIAKRQAAKYCSNACKTKAYRVRNDIPSPDFSEIIPAKLPSEKERKLLFLRDELNKIIFEEAALEKDYKLHNDKYEKALRIYEESPSVWSRDYSERRRISYNEIRSKLVNLQIERVKLEKEIEKVQRGLDREILNKKQLILTSDEIRLMRFNTIEFEGKWKEVFGNPANNFHIIITGNPKSGTSTFALQFADYIKKFGAVVYMAVQEQLSFTFQQKIIRYNISGIDLSKAKTKQEIEYVIKKGNYDFIFIDSINNNVMRMSDLAEIKKKYPKTALITVVQLSKPGDIREIYRLQHECDIFVEVTNNGIAKARGRFKSYGEYKIFG